MSGRGGSARQSNLEIKRADVYVDGFNLYHGLRELGRRRLPWLDLRSMITRVLRPDQRLETLDHFTAGVRNDPPGVARQQVYLAAPESVGVTVVLGRFQEQRVRCRACGHTRLTYAEKPRVVTAFPPRRRSEGLHVVSDAWFPPGDAVIRQSRLPATVGGADGAVYRRPAYWN